MSSDEGGVGEEAVDVPDAGVPALTPPPLLVLLVLLLPKKPLRFGFGLLLVLPPRAILRTSFFNGESPTWSGLTLESASNRSARKRVQKLKSRCLKGHFRA